MLSTSCIVSDKDSGPSSPPSSQSVLSEPSDVVSTCSASGDGLTAISGVLRGCGFPIALSSAFAGCRGMKLYEQLNMLGSRGANYASTRMMLCKKRLQTAIP